mmetsp:Transcript_16230/g.26402  ORF Transcript_16230/g.26402 Transcript_16230/m.26402 type:complete len:302 (+) Transcript_16230:1290-2195(+)
MLAVFHRIFKSLRAQGVAVSTVATDCSEKDMTRSFISPYPSAAIGSMTFTPPPVLSRSNMTPGLPSSPAFRIVGVAKPSERSQFVVDATGLILKLLSLLSHVAVGDEIVSPRNKDMLNKKASGYTFKARATRHATTDHPMKAQFQYPTIPNTERPSSKKIAVSARCAPSRNTMSALTLVIDDKLGNTYRLAVIPVNRMVTIPDKCRISAIKNGMYIKTIRTEISTRRLCLMSICLNKKPAQAPPKHPRMSDPTEFKKRSMKNSPNATATSPELRSLVTNLPKQLNRTMANASFNTDSPKHR